MLTKALIATSVVILAASLDPKTDWPGDRVTDEMRAKGVELLKEAYKLNGNSMVGYGAYDLNSGKADRLPLPEKPEKK